MAWLLLSEVAAFPVMAVVNLVVALYDRITGAQAWLSPFVVVVISGTSTQLTMLLAAWRQAAVLGGGDVSAGLSNDTTRRRGIICLLAAIPSAFIAARAWNITHWIQTAPAPARAALSSLHGIISLPVAIAVILLATALAPICEELFFRGWLWTGLRRRWSRWSVAATTGALWLLIHYPEGGLDRVVALLPAAIALSVAREIGGSVRASILVHVVNNVTVVAVLAIMLR